MAQNGPKPGSDGPRFAQDRRRWRTERLRGLCKRDAQTFTNMRDFYRSKEREIFSVIDSYKENLSEKEFNRVTKYIKSFYDIVKSDDEFRNKILSKCRG